MRMTVFYPKHVIPSLSNNSHLKNNDYTTGIESFINIMIIRVYHEKSFGDVTS